MELSENVEFNDYDLDGLYDGYVYSYDLVCGVLFNERTVVIEDEVDKEDIQVVVSFKYSKFFKYGLGVFDVDLDVKSREYNGLYIFDLQARINDLVYEYGVMYDGVVLVRLLVDEIVSVLCSSEEEIIGNLC
jgi:hypothetical protein